MPRRSLPKAKSAGRALSAAESSVESPAIAALARRHAEAALAALIEVVGDRSASPAARISAASTLLNWGFGKSSASGNDDGPAELVIRWRNVQEGQEEKPAAGKAKPGPKPKS